MNSKVYRQDVFFVAIDLDMNYKKPLKKVNYYADITWVGVHPCLHANLIMVKAIFRPDETDHVLFAFLVGVFTAREKHHYQIERQNNQNCR